MDDNCIKVDCNYQCEHGREFYSPPEIYMDAIIDPIPIDLWSIGVLLFEMCTFSLPYNSIDQLLKTEYFNTEYLCIAPFNYSQDLSVIITSLLSINVNDRPFVESLLQSQYMESVKGKCIF